MCELKCNSAQNSPKKQSKRSLFDNGEMAVTLPPRPRCQAVGLVYLSVKLKQKSFDRKLCFDKDTCPMWTPIKVVS